MQKFDPSEKYLITEKYLMNQPRKKLTRKQRKERAELKRKYIENIFIELMLKLKSFYIKKGWTPRAAINNTLSQIDNISEKLIKKYPKEAHLIRQVTNKLKSQANKYIQTEFKDYFQSFFNHFKIKGKEIDVEI